MNHDIKALSKQKWSIPMCFRVKEKLKNKRNYYTGEWPNIYFLKSNFDFRTGLLQNTTTKNVGLQFKKALSGFICLLYFFWIWKQWYFLWSWPSNHVNFVSDISKVMAFEIHSCLRNSGPSMSCPSWFSWHKKLIT